jgi:hypothetical protein
MKRFLFAAAVPAMLFAGLANVGCASRHEEGVKSTYRSQKVMVYADTKATTAAAEAVLKEADLKDVASKSTTLDGEAWGMMADGTKVKASVEAVENGSKVWVNIGTLGDPEKGAMLASSIKKRAEGK